MKHTPVAKEISCSSSSLLSRVRNILKKKFSNSRLEKFMADHEKTLDERDRLIGQLTRSEEKYRSVFENTGTATLILGADAIILHVNHEFEELSGYAKEELEGKKYLKHFLFPDDMKEFEKSLHRIDRDDAVPAVPHEFRFLNRKGEIYHVLCRLGVMPRKGQKVLSLIDITKRKKAEEAVREKEANLSSIFRAAPIGIGVVLDGVIRSVNLGFCEMLGYSMEELIHRNMATLFKDKKEFKRVVDSMAEQIRKSGTGTIRTTWERKDKQTIEIRLSATAIDPEDQGSAITFTALDISESIHAQVERERLESQLRQAQKMEAIGTLAGGIAHDFNNILAAIIGYTEMIIEDLEEEPAVQQRLDQVLMASFRARDLVSQILTFSRQTDGEKQAINVTLVIKEALKLLRATLPTTITFKEVFTAEHDRIYANATQVHQVLMNLCTNAKQAMCKNGGLLTVSLEDIHLEEKKNIGHFRLPPGQYIRLSVSDTGHGMPSEVADRIFEPYFTTKGTVDGGTGLGLAVVHGIVHDNGGAVEMFSEPDKGARFDVYFPITKDPDTQSEIKPAIPSNGNERILLVDDEEQLVNMYSEMLGSLGYQVMAKTDSNEALKAFRSKPDAFDLILTDYTMPNLTGTQLADKVLQIRADIPVVLYSGFAEDITPEKAKGMGIREMLPKPLIKSEISAVIRKCFDTQGEF